MKRTLLVALIVIALPILAQNKAQQQIRLKDNSAQSYQSKKDANYFRSLSKQLLLNSKKKNVKENDILTANLPTVQKKIAEMAYQPMSSFHRAPSPNLITLLILTFAFLELKYVSATRCLLQQVFENDQKFMYAQCTNQIYNPCINRNATSIYCHKVCDVLWWENCPPEKFIEFTCPPASPYCELIAQGFTCMQKDNDFICTDETTAASLPIPGKPIVIKNLGQPDETKISDEQPIDLSQAETKDAPL